VLSRKDWLPERVIVFAAPLLAVALMGLGGQLAAGQASKPHPAPEFVSVMTGTLGFQGALLAGLTWFLQSHRCGWNAAFGFRSSPALPAVARGVALALLVLPFAYGLQWLSVHGLRAVGLPSSGQNSVEFLLRTGSAWERAGLAVFAVGVAPAVEEMLFRGVFYVFVRDLGFPRMALIGSAVFFGMVHSNFAALIPLSLFGAALAWLYSRTGNLVSCIAAHATFNLVPFLMLALGWKFGEGAAGS
jgi:membrane protease YdiL (CAAX protease family)